jgi:hypothetical protein
MAGSMAIRRYQVRYDEQVGTGELCIRVQSIDKIEDVLPVRQDVQVIVDGVVVQRAAHQHHVRWVVLGNHDLEGGPRHRISLPR